MEAEDALLIGFKKYCSGFLSHRATPKFKSSIYRWDVPWNKPSSHLAIPPFFALNIYGWWAISLHHFWVKQNHSSHKILSYVQVISPSFLIFSPHFSIIFGWKIIFLPIFPPFSHHFSPFFRTRAVPGPVDTRRRCPTRRSHPDGRRPGATRRRRRGRGHPMGDFPWGTHLSTGTFHMFYNG